MSLTPHQANANEPPEPPKSVVVIGAGVSGLACAGALARAGIRTTVLDRGRVPGCRLAPRPSSTDDTDIRFDHGTPCLQASGGTFGKALRHWIDRGAAAEWMPRRATWRDGLLRDEDSSMQVVGVPSIAAIPGLLAEELDIRTSTTVESIESVPDGWRLAVTPWREVTRTLGPFPTVVLAMAPGQARRLLANPAPELAAALEPVRTATIWVGMLELEGADPELPDLIETPDHPVIRKLIREDGKPGRRRDDRRTHWVVHADPVWSGDRYDVDRTEIAELLGTAAHELLQAISGSVIELLAPPVAHRWGMARTVEPVPSLILVDATGSLVVCGDGLGGNDVAAAHAGGLAAAAAILDSGS